MMQRALTIEDLFQKYQSDKGVPSSSDVIRWANKFGSTIEPEEEVEFRDYYKNLLAQANPPTYLGGESSSYSNDGMGGNNYWAQREAKVGKAQVLAEQVADRAKLPALLAQAAIPGLAAIKGVQNFFDPPTKSYAVPFAQMSREDKEYAQNINPPAAVMDAMIAVAEANDTAKNAAEAAALEANTGINIGDFGGSDSSVARRQTVVLTLDMDMVWGLPRAVRFALTKRGGDDTLEEMAGDERSMVDRVIDTLPDNFFGVPISPDTYKNLGMTGLGYMLGIGPLMAKYNQAKYGTKAAINAYDMSMGNMPAFRGYSAPVENRSTYSDDALNEAMDKAIQSGEMAKGTDVDGSAGGSGGGDYSTSSDAYSDAGGVWAKGGLIDKASLALNKPRRTPDHATKSHVVKTKVDGKEKIIRFGQQGASTAGKPKAGESDRMTAKRDSFKARHSANIAKGPSSAAYWANKVKWADGGPVKTHYAEGDSVRATPQNAALGSIANLIKESYSPQRTQQMQGVSKFFDMPALARTVERLSYGEPITNIGKANVPLIPEDTAAAAMLVGPPLGSYAKRVGTNLIQTAPYVARDMMQSMASPLRSYVVKQRGGNWLAGGIEEAIDTLRRAPVLSGEIINNAAGRDLFSEYRKVYDQDATIGLHQWTRKNYPDIYEKALYGDSFGPERAINNWLDKTLYKYIKNDMGTPEDQMRALAERGQMHIDTDQVNYILDAYGKYPKPGQEFLAKSDLAKVWEGAVDNNISTERAGKFLDLSDNTNPYAHARLQENPWLSKVPPETQVNQLSEPENLTYDLGFDHMVDEMRNAMNPDSGLPARLMIDPAKLEKMTVPQISEHVGQINAWRAAQAKEAEKLGMMGNLTASPRLQDPTTQLSFVDKPGMTWVDIPATTDKTANKLCTTIGKQAGWCTQGRDLAESYGSGNNRLTTLLDAAGRPHVQAMITQQSDELRRADFLKQFSEEQYDNVLKADPQQVKIMFEEWSSKNPLSFSIKELKPVGNTFSSARSQEYMKRDPQYEQKVTDSVVKFLNSGEWGKVNDLKHYDIVDLTDTTSVTNYIHRVFGDESGMLPIDDYVDKFNYATNFNPDAPRFMTSRQFRDFVEPNFGKEGYAEGGSVSAYDPFQVDEIMNSINAPQNYAQGGSVSVYDPDQDRCNS
jgi:hypothetical protein